MNTMKKIALLTALLFLLTGTAFAADQTIAATEEMVGSGHATKTDTLNRLGLVEHNTDGTHKAAITGLSVTAGKTITATQDTALDEAVSMSSKLTLALGAANLKAFMNAAGTAPQWAAGMKLVTFSRDTSTASGDQAVTGVGFKPSHVVFLMSYGAALQASLGFDDGTIHYSAGFFNVSNVANSSPTSTKSIFSVEPTTANQYTGYITALGADGFTITWTKSSSPTFTIVIYAFCFR